MRNAGKHRALALLATAGLLLNVLASPRALAANDVWQTTGAGGSQDWFLPANWSAGVPGTGDSAIFSTNVPPSNTVNISANTGIGAILDLLTPTAALNLNGTATLSLYGQNVTVAEPGGNFTQANTILANTTSLTTVKNLTLASTLNPTLVNAQNNILATGGSGSAAGQVITINGNIADGAGASSLAFLGGGTGSASGGTLVLGGTNAFSGGLTIGNTAGTQGGAVSVSAAGNLPSAGNILVNEQGQLLFTKAGTYGAPGQLLTLNGIGENKNSSGALRTGGNASDLFVWQGDVSLGTSAPADANNGFVVVSVTSAATKIFEFRGKLTGAGSLQKQGAGQLLISGTNNDNTGGNQIGNGVLTVAAGSRMGTGDLDLFQTSTNTATVNLFNAAQTIGNLSSHFTATSGGSATVDAQYLNLGDPANTADHAHVLTVNQTKDFSFGYGAVNTLTATIQGGGSLVLGAGSNHTLSLTGPNAYTGGTTVNGGTLNLANGAGSGAGSATGTGDATVNAGGHLASGNGVSVFGSTVTSGSLSGNLIVNSGGFVLPGGANLVGSLNVGGLAAHSGSIFTFDLLGGTNAQADSLTASGAATLDAGGTETLNLAGSKLAFGTYQLLNFNGLTNAGTQFSLGATPGGTAAAGATHFVGNNNRVYDLLTNTSGVTLTITDTGSERIYSVGGVNPAADGAGTIVAGSTNFFNTNPNTTQAPYDNASNNDVIIGNGGAGATITLSGNVRVGGSLIFGAVTSPYTVGAAGGTQTLTLAKGIAASNSATINAPILLEAAQTFAPASGTTVTVNNGIGETGGSAKQLTKDDLGTLILAGTSSYTGGTVIANGVLQGTTTSIPASGGVTDNASLVFAQATSGSYAGAITGTGSVTVANTAPAAAITLANTTNSYSCTTNIQSGILSVGAVGSLGTGDGGITLGGGTLQLTGNLSFPLNAGNGTPARALTLVAGTTSTVDTGANNVTLGQNVGGSGNLTKAGSGTLTLTGLPSTTVIGQVAITGGNLVFAPPANVPSFGISAPAAPSVGNNMAGDLTIATPLELRLFGGDFAGGGNFRIKPSAINFVSRGATTIDDNIILNDNASPTPGFSINIGANTGNTLTINGVISGQADVDFTGGTGIVALGGASTYTGATTIDNGSGGEVQLLANNALPVTTAVHVTSTGILNLNGHNQTVASIDSTSTASQVINEAAAAASVLTINGTTATTFNGVLEDGQTSTLGLTLAAANTGSLAVTNTNLNSGLLTVAGGRLDVQNLAALGAPSLITAGATAGNSQIRFSGLTGTPTFASSANPTAPASPITLNGLGGYNPGTGAEPGALRVANASTLSLPDNITFAADSAIAVTADSTLTLTGNLAGTGALVKVGAGPLTVAGTATGYTGGTQVNEGTLTVNAGSALGTGALQVNNANAAAGTDVLLNLKNAAQTVGSLSGAIATPASGANTATIQLANNAALTVNQTTDGAFDGVIAGAGASLTKNGAAKLTLTGTETYTGGTTVGGGTLDATAGSIVASLGPMSVSGAGSTLLASKIAPSSLTIGAGSAVRLPTTANPANVLSTVGSLSINGGAAPTGTLDLNNHDLVITSGVLATVSAQVRSGYASGAWTGPGITSTAAKANFRYAVGYVQNGTPGSPARATIDGRNLTGGEILIKSTYVGDTDLNGLVDSQDINSIVGRGRYNDGTTNATWQDGDFTNDGKVDSKDINLLVGAGTYQLGQISNPPAAGPLPGGATAGAAKPALSAPVTLTGGGGASTGGASANSSPAGTVGDGQVDFRYDPATGDVTFLRDGFDSSKKIQTLTLRSASQQFVTGVGTTSAGAGFDTDQHDLQYVYRLNGLAAAANGTFDLGNILPANLTLARLQSDLSVYYLYQGAGVGGDGIPADLVGVPEPAAGLAILGLVGGALLARRRRGAAAR